MIFLKSFGQKRFKRTLPPKISFFKRQAYILEIGLIGLMVWPFAFSFFLKNMIGHEIGDILGMIFSIFYATRIVNTRTVDEIKTFKNLYFRACLITFCMMILFFCFKYYLIHHR